ncbi:MAG: hypothetical protein JXA92_01950 [candidate division Zixibacteria bacterium]|nr:hypothetical protein [candidate division Zixibacteria bacterium]
MIRILSVLLLIGIVAGCSSGVRFIPLDETYVKQAKPRDAEIIFQRNAIERPHRVIGIIEAELGRKARKPELNTLIIKKAREIGADGVMLVEYDVDREVYIQTHHAVIGRGPYKRHVVGHSRRVEVKRTASAVAIIF